MTFPLFLRKSSKLGLPVAVCLLYHRCGKVPLASSGALRYSCNMLGDRSSLSQLHSKQRKHRSLRITIKPRTEHEMLLDIRCNGEIVIADWAAEYAIAPKPDPF